MFLELRGSSAERHIDGRLTRTAPIQVWQLWFSPDHAAGINAKGGRDDLTFQFGHLAELRFGSDHHVF